MVCISKNSHSLPSGEVGFGSTELSCGILSNICRFFFLFFPNNDFRVLRDTYGSRVPPSVLSERVAHYVHYFTLHGSLRPFGASVMLAAYDDELKEPQL